MRSKVVPLVAIPLAVAALTAGCGSSEKIPEQTAAALGSNLETVENRVEAGECQEARAQLRRVDRTVGGLPRDVDPRVRSTLGRGVDHLGELIGKQCKQKPEPVKRPVAPPVVTTPEPAPTVTESQEPQVEEPKQPEKPEKRKEAEAPEKKPEKPNESKQPTTEEKDICGENPAPEC
jgi:outer membrane biosynthesis protein TonB